VIRIFRVLYAKLRRSIEMSRYDDFTIAEYFRQKGAQIGEGNRLEIRNLGPEPYLVKIGNHCTVAPNVSFLVHDGATWLFTEEDPSLQKFAPIVIEDNCFIGMSSIIMGGVTVGPNSVVGAGSVVTKDVPPGTVVAGNPARHLCAIDEYREKVVKAWAAQKPPGYFDGFEKGRRCAPSHIYQAKKRDSGLLKGHLKEKFWGGKGG